MEFPDSRPYSFYFLKLFRRYDFKITLSFSMLRIPNSTSFSYNSGYIKFATSRGLLPPSFSTGAEST